VAPSLVDSGRQGAVQVIIANRNTSPLTLVDLLVDYPDGTRDPANPTATLSHIRDSIGTINSGQQIKQNADGIFYGAEGSAQKVTVTLEYSVSGSNAPRAAPKRARIWRYSRSIDSISKVTCLSSISARLGIMDARL